MDDATLLSWIERGRTLSFLLVAIGVVGEFLVDRISSPIIKRRDEAQRAEIAKLSRDTSEANARAAEANRIAEQERLARVQLEAKLAPRTLSAEQQTRIRSELTKLAGRYVTITFINDNFEAAAFASQIRDAFSQAKWVITRFSQMTPGGNGLPIVRGVLIMTEPPDKSVESGRAVLAVLRKEQILADMMPFDRKGTPEQLSEWKNSTNPENARILVVVGSHP